MKLKSNTMHHHHHHSHIGFKHHNFNSKSLNSNGSINNIFNNNSLNSKSLNSNGFNNNSSILSLIIVNGILNHSHIKRNNHANFREKIQLEQHNNLYVCLEKLYKQYFVYWKENNFEQVIIYHDFIKDILLLEKFKQETITYRLLLNKFNYITYILNDKQFNDISSLKIEELDELDFIINVFLKNNY